MGLVLPDRMGDYCPLQLNASNAKSMRIRE
jgi:hypothetical protein